MKLILWGIIKWNLIRPYIRLQWPSDAVVWRNREFIVEIARINREWEEDREVKNILLQGSVWWAICVFLRNIEREEEGKAEKILQPEGKKVSPLICE